MPLFDTIHLLTNPWRISLLFFVSGAATAFALSRRTPSALRQKRSFQLLPVFLTAMILLVPPQIYVFLTVREGLSIDLAEVFRRYLTLQPFLLADGSLQVIVSMEHLWYLAYLWTYTAILMTLLGAREKAILRFGDWMTAQLRGAGLLVWPVIFFFVVRVTLRPFFPPSNNIIDDWYSHVCFLACFSGGVLLGGRRDFWEAILAVREPALIGAAACIPLLLAMFSQHPISDQAAWNSPTGCLLVAAFMWCTMVAILGYGQRLRAVDHPALRYLNKAVLSYYILHQTIMVLIAAKLEALGLLGPAAFLPLAAATLVACALLYEVWRRLWLLVARPRFAPAP